MEKKSHDSAAKFQLLYQLNIHIFLCYVLDTHINNFSYKHFSFWCVDQYLMRGKKSEKIRKKNYVAYRHWYTTTYCRIK